MDNLNTLKVEKNLQQKSVYKRKELALGAN